MTMNTLNAYSVYDVKTELYSQPHFLQTNGHAIRSFSLACEDTTTDLHKFSSDYSLYHIGTFDITTATLNSITPKQLCSASEFVNKPTQITYDFLKSEIDKLQSQIKINKTISETLNS